MKGRGIEREIEIPSMKTQIGDTKGSLYDITRKCMSYRDTEYLKSFIQTELCQDYYDKVNKQITVSKGRRACRTLIVANHLNAVNSMYYHS